MRECPEIKDLAHFVETGEGSADLVQHLRACDACQEARKSLADEAMSLQISISELWFREQVSCPEPQSLDRFLANALPAEEQAYVQFHLQTLKCPTCDARIGEAEISRSPAESRKASRSRARVADATTKLLGDEKKRR